MSRLAPPRTPPGGHVVVLGRPNQAGSYTPVSYPSRAAAATPQPARPTRPQRPGRRPSPRTLQRRRQVLAVLVAAAVVTGVGGLWLGGVAWVPFLLAYAALFGYLALLAQLRARRDEARSKLAYLHPPRAQPPLTSGVRIRTARGA
ncbi:MAG TPA: hypothetical protein VM324_03615 [Egibacteraceae bacterium]|nr:hypothetical protein [Egibacteraceae bacterium]